MKRKIVIFIDWFVPAYKAGGPIRSVLNITSTFGEEAEFYVITSNKDLGEASPLAGIEENKWLQLGFAKVIYLDIMHQNAERYLQLLNEVKPDVVYLNSLFSKNFTLLPLSIVKKDPKFKDAKLILAPRGMLGKGALAIKPLKKKLFFIYARIKGLFNSIIWHASTDLEVAEIKEIIGKHSIAVVAQNLAILPQNVEVRSKASTPFLNIIFVSRIAIKKNLQLLANAIISSKYKAQFHLTIIGAIEDEAYFNAIQTSLKNAKINFQYIGAVPQEKLKQYYEQAHVFCLPTWHENYGHAIVEAMSFALPIIISQNTPWRNLQQKGVGYDLPVDVVDFTKALDAFIEMSDEAYAHYSSNALQYAKSILLNPKVIQSNRKLFLNPDYALEMRKR